MKFPYSQFNVEKLQNNQQIKNLSKKDIEFIKNYYTFNKQNQEETIRKKIEMASLKIMKKNSQMLPQQLIQQRTNLNLNKMNKFQQQRPSSHYIKQQTLPFTNDQQQPITIQKNRTIEKSKRSLELIKKQRSFFKQKKQKQWRIQKNQKQKEYKKKLSQLQIFLTKNPRQKYNSHFKIRAKSKNKKYRRRKKSKINTYQKQSQKSSIQNSQIISQNTIRNIDIGKSFEQEEKSMIPIQPAQLSEKFFPAPDDMNENNMNISFDEAEIDDIFQCKTKRTRRKIFLLQSIYRGRPSTAFFPYPSCCKLENGEGIRARIQDPLQSKQKVPLMTFKFPGTGFSICSKICLTAGLKEVSGIDWNCCWNRNPVTTHWKNMNEYQKSNHFPGSFQLGHKDLMYRNLAKMRRLHPKAFDFIPRTYFATDWARFKQDRKNAKKSALWIAKPASGCCGKGIYLIDKGKKPRKRNGYIISEYISNPHLLNGFKYDLRIYVLVSSFEPLKIYMYPDGLTRICSSLYSTKVKSRFSHLTNFSINKKANNFQKPTKSNEFDGVSGNKWSFIGLRKKYEELGINYDQLFAQIEDIIIKTVISVEQPMQAVGLRPFEQRNNYFEIYGFDILIDQRLKPWLIEVNICPSLSASSTLDRRIKTSLMVDSLNLVGFIPQNIKKIIHHQELGIPDLNEKKKTKKKPKRLEKLGELTAENCIDKLVTDDWTLLFETHEEFQRQGQFKRIYPVKETMDQYKDYFTSNRYSNLLIEKWLKCSENFLEKICQKDYQ